MQKNLENFGDSSFGVEASISDQQSPQDSLKLKTGMNVEIDGADRERKMDGGGGDEGDVAVESNQVPTEEHKTDVKIEKKEPGKKSRIETEEERQQRLKKKQERLRAQLYMSDSEFEVEEEELQRSDRSFRNVTKIDYNENKRVPTHQIVHDKKHLGSRGRRSRSHNSSPMAQDSKPSLRGLRSRSGARKRKEASPGLRNARTNESNEDPNKKKQRIGRQRIPDENKTTKFEKDDVLKEIGNEASKDQEMNRKHKKAQADATEKKRLKEEASKHPLSDFQRKLLEDTNIKFLEKLSASELPAKIRNITESNEVSIEQQSPRSKQIREIASELSKLKTNHHFLDFEDSEYVSQLQNIIADEYYVMSKKFVEAQVNHIDELVKTIDTCVKKSKNSYEQYRQQIEDSKRNYLDNNELRGSSKEIKDILNTLRPKKLVPAILFPNIFEKVIGWGYSGYSRMKEECFCRLDMIDRLTTGNKQIARDRYERSLRENRESMKMEIMNELKELDTEFTRETGLSPAVANIDSSPSIDSFESDYRPDRTALNKSSDASGTDTREKGATKHS